MLRLFILMAAILMMTPSADGAWGQGGGQVCPTALRPTKIPAQAVARYQWVGTLDCDDDCLELDLGGRQVGCYRYSRACYWPIHNGEWGEAAEPPIPVPGLSFFATRQKVVAALEENEGRPSVGDDLPTGVDYTKLPAKPGMSIGGRELPDCEEGCKNLFGDLPASEAKKPYICVLGDKTYLAAAKSYFGTSGEGAALAVPCLIGYFEPGDWQVKGIQFDVPGMTLFGSREADGKAKTLWTQPEQAGFAENALRIVNPEFRPEKIPNPLRPKPMPSGPAGLPWYENKVFMAIGAFVLFLLSFLRKK
jgi:hypothetical protein